MTSSIGIAILPKVAAQAARGNIEGIRRLATSSIGTVIWLMAPIASLGALYAFDAVRLVIGGSVDDVGAAATSDLLRILLVGLVAHGVISVAVRLFYGLRDTARPTLAELGGSVVIFALATLWVPMSGVIGIAAALPLGTWIEALLLIGLLSRGRGVLGAARVASMVLFSVAAALLSTLIAAAVTLPVIEEARSLGILPAAAVAAFGTALGLVAYLTLTLVARREEALPLLRRIAPVAPRALQSVLLRAEGTE